MIRAVYEMRLVVISTQSFGLYNGLGIQRSVNDTQSEGTKSRDVLC